MTEQPPAIDFEHLPNPSEGFLVTHFLTVRSVARSRAFYSDLLGGQVVLEQNPCMIKLANSCHEPGRWPHARQARHLGRRLRAREHGLQLLEPSRRGHPRVLRAVAREGRSS